jgi:hypothetical protein
VGTSFHLRQQDPGCLSPFSRHPGSSRTFWERKDLGGPHALIFNPLTGSVCSWHRLWILQGVSSHTSLKLNFTSSIWLNPEHFWDVQIIRIMLKNRATYFDSKVPSFRFDSLKRFHLFLTNSLMNPAQKTQQCLDKKGFAWHFVLSFWYCQIPIGNKKLIFVTPYVRHRASFASDPHKCGL